MNGRQNLGGQSSVGPARVQGQEIGYNLGKSALGVFEKFAADENIIGAANVIDSESAAATMRDDQFLESIAGAGASGQKLPTGRCAESGFGHENAMMMTLLNCHSVKNIVAGLAHKNAQIIIRQHRVADDIMVEAQVQGNAGREIIVQIEMGEMAVFGGVAGEPVKLAVERRKILHRKPPSPGRAYQAAGAAMRANDMIHLRPIRAPHHDAVVVNSAAIGEKSPYFLFLMRSIAIDKQVRKLDALNRVVGGGFQRAQDHDRTIGVIG